MKKVFTLSALLLVALATHGQQHFTQYLYWIRYQNQLHFSPLLSWVNEVDNRRFFDPDVALQFIAHSRLHYKINRWDFAGGLTYSVAYAQVNTEGWKNSTTELRPVVEASYEIPLKKFSLQSRLRMDNRFIQNDPEQSVFQQSTFVIRFRYRLQARIPLTTKEDGTAVTVLKLADEIMINDRKNTFDQNRIYAMVEFPLAKNLTGEAGYIYIHQQRLGKEQFFDRNILRISFLHRIKLY